MILCRLALWPRTKFLLVNPALVIGRICQYGLLTERIDRRGVNKTSLLANCWLCLRVVSASARDSIPV